MKEVVIGCSGAKHIAKEIAQKRGSSYSQLSFRKFPDGEIEVKFNLSEKEIKGKNILFVQSFYPGISDKIVETLFAGHTAKEMGAKKIRLLSLYFPYWRKDKRFSKGECISIEVMGRLFSFFNKIYFVEPHLHRIPKVKKVFKKGKRVEVSEEIANYIKKLKLKDVIFVGPDSESYQWARKDAEILSKKSVILKKKRSGDKRVKIVFNKKIDIKGKNVVIIDDIISTGHTMLETIKQLKKYKPKKIYCIAIHGIFADKKALEKLEKESVVLSTNTIDSKKSKIDISTIGGKIK